MTVSIQKLVIAQEKLANPKWVTSVGGCWPIATTSHFYHGIALQQ